VDAGGPAAQSRIFGRVRRCEQVAITERDYAGSSILVWTSVGALPHKLLQFSVGAPFYWWRIACTLLASLVAYL